MANTAEQTETNFAYVARMKEQHELTYRKLADLSCYSEESVRAWFSDPDSSKFRQVPDRAVKLLKMEIGDRKVI